MSTTLVTYADGERTDFQVTDRVMARIQSEWIGTLTERPMKITTVDGLTIKVIRNGDDLTWWPA